MVGRPAAGGGPEVGVVNEGKDREVERERESQRERDRHPETEKMSRWRGGESAHNRQVHDIRQMGFALSSLNTSFDHEKKTQYTVQQ